MCHSLTQRVGKSTSNMGESQPRTSHVPIFCREHLWKLEDLWNIWEHLWKHLINHNIRGNISWAKLRETLPEAATGEQRRLS